MVNRLSSRSPRRGESSSPSRWRPSPWLTLTMVLGGCRGAALAVPPEGADAARAPAAVEAITSPVLRTAIDLVANRVQASSYQNGHLVIDAGSTDFLKYTDGGWKTAFTFGQMDQGH